MALSPEEYMNKYGSSNPSSFREGKKTNATKRRIEELRREFGITRSEFDHPEYIVPKSSSELPVLDISTMKFHEADNSLMEQMDHYHKRQKRKINDRVLIISRWYMHYLKPETVEWIDRKYRNNYDGFVNCLYQQASMLIQLNLPKEEMTLDEYNISHPVTIQSSMEKTQMYGVDENAPGKAILYVDEESGDIPEYYWKEYKKYCRKHKLKNGMTAHQRRQKFLHKINKRYKKLSGKRESSKKFAKRYVREFTQFGHEIKKREIEYVLEQHKKNYEMIQRNAKDWVKRGVATKEACDQLLERSHEIMDNFKKRMKMLNKTLRNQSEIEKRIQCEVWGSEDEYQMEYAPGKFATITFDPDDGVPITIYQ